MVAQGRGKDKVPQSAMWNQFLPFGFVFFYQGQVVVWNFMIGEHKLIEFSLFHFVQSLQYVQQFTIDLHVTDQFE